MKKSIKYAGIAAATLLAVAPVAAPVVSQAASTDATSTDAPINTVSVKVAYVLTDAKGNALSKADNTKTTTDPTDYQYVSASKAYTGQAGSSVVLDNVLTSDYSVIGEVNDAGVQGTQGFATLDANKTSITLAKEGTMFIGVTKDNKVTDDQKDVDKAIAKFGAQFADRNADDVNAGQIEKNGNSIWSSIALGSANKTDVNTFNKNNVGFIDSVASSDYLSTLENHGAQVYFTATDAAGNTYDGQIGSFRDLQKAVNDSSKLPLNVKVFLRYNDLTTGLPTAYQQIAKFNITSDATDEMTQVNANFTDPLNVALNSKVAATQYVNNSNVTLKDQDGDSVATKDIALSNAYFDTYSDAMDAARKADVNGADGVTTGTTSQDDVDTSNDGEFKTSGTYYQVVSYYAKDSSSLSQFLAKYTTDPSGYAVYVNGKKASKGYDFTTASKTDGTNQVISFVRAINVSNNSSQWTTSSVDGVVTTKNAKDYYTLVNTDGNQIKNRALAKNSAWKADKVRTDQNGNKQYRVATDEWIDANDVTFGDAATVDTSALTDIQSVTGTVKLENASMVYFLYNKAGEQVKNRALSGNSAWKVINTAKDADGNTYYRVATDEWVMQGTGVSFN